MSLPPLCEDKSGESQQPPVTESVKLPKIENGPLTSRSPDDLNDGWSLITKLVEEEEKACRQTIIGDEKLAAFYIATNIEDSRQDTQSMEYVAVAPVELEPATVLAAAPPKVAPSYPPKQSIHTAPTDKLTSKSTLLALEYLCTQERTRRVDVEEQQELEFISLSIKLMQIIEESQLEHHYSTIYNNEKARVQRDRDEILHREKEYRDEVDKALMIQEQPPKPLPTYAAPPVPTKDSILHLPGYERSYLPTRKLTLEEHFEAVHTMCKDEENLRPRILKMERAQRGLLYDHWGGTVFAHASLKIQCAWRQWLARREMEEMQRLREERLQDTSSPTPKHASGSYQPPYPQNLHHQQHRYSDPWQAPARSHSSPQYNSGAPHATFSNQQGPSWWTAPPRPPGGPVPYNKHTRRPQSVGTVGGPMVPQAAPVVGHPPQQAPPVYYSNAQQPQPTYPVVAPQQHSQQQQQQQMSKSTLWSDPEMRSRMELVKECILVKFKPPQQTEVLQYVQATLPHVLHGQGGNNRTDNIMDREGGQQQHPSLNLYEMSHTEFESFESYVFGKAMLHGLWVPSNAKTNANHTQPQPTSHHHPSQEKHAVLPSHYGATDVRTSQQSWTHIGHGSPNIKELTPEALQARELLAERIQTLLSDEQKVLVQTVKKVAPQSLKKADGKLNIDTAELNEEQYLRVSNVVLELLNESKIRATDYKKRLELERLSIARDRELDELLTHRDEVEIHRKRLHQEEVRWRSEQKKRDEEERQLLMHLRLDEEKKKEGFRMELEKRDHMERLRWEREEYEKEAVQRAADRERRIKDLLNEEQNHKVYLERSRNADLEERMYHKRQRELSVRAQEYELEKRHREDEESRMLLRDQAVLARELYDMTPKQLDEIAKFTINLCPTAVVNHRVLPSLVPSISIQWVLKKAVELKGGPAVTDRVDDDGGGGGGRPSSYRPGQVPPLPPKYPSSESVVGSPSSTVRPHPPPIPPTTTNVVQHRYTTVPDTGRNGPTADIPMIEDREVRQFAGPPLPHYQQQPLPPHPPHALSSPTTDNHPPQPSSSSSGGGAPQNAPTSAPHKPPPSPTSVMNQTEPSLEQKSVLKDAIVNLPAKQVRKVVGELRKLCPQCIVLQEGKEVHIDTQFLDSSNFYIIQELALRPPNTGSTSSSV